MEGLCDNSHIALTRTLSAICKSTCVLFWAKIRCVLALSDATKFPASF